MVKDMIETDPAEWAQSIFDWSNQLNRGYFPCDVYLARRRLPSPYSPEYIEKYVEYERTEKGRLLTTFRAGLVNKITRGPVIDIGVGAGTFVNHRNTQRFPTFGFDINEDKTKALIGKERWINPYAGPCAVMTFWDSLEHIKNPDPLLMMARSHVFMTIPIFRDEKHARTSKHFRPDEHYHYFTNEGLCNYMERRGFESIAISTMEIYLGREDVQTYVFKRVRL